jgi:hypothetical protein
MTIEESASKRKSPEQAPGFLGSVLILRVWPKKRPMKLALAIWFVMPGLVPGIHVLTALKQERRGWPGRSPAMTESESLSIC